MHGGPALSTNLEKAQWVGQASVLGIRTWHKHVLLTISLLGLQLVWSTEFAQAAPYLLSLGLSKSFTSLVFLAGPLAGLIVQPLIGSYADNCKLSIGRRRPFIIGGGIICIASLVLFGFAKEIAGIFSVTDSGFHKFLTLSLAILSIYTLDFSINAVQAMDRALLVDSVPASQQEEVNAWASRMLGFGSVVGFWIGGADLVSAFSWVASSQIKLISILAILTFVACHALTCYSVTERVLIKNDSTHTSGLLAALKSIWKAYRTLPLPIWRIFQVQIFGWIGMFGILFYSSTWVAEIYLRDHLATSGDLDLSDVPEEVMTAATRTGSYALFYQALISVTTAVILPFFVAPTGDYNIRPRAPPRSIPSPAAEESIWVKLRYYLDVATQIITASLPDLPLSWFNLPLAWCLSHCIFVVLMLATYFVSSSVGLASVIVALTGFPLAVTGWAPFSMLGELILDTSSMSPATSMDEYRAEHNMAPALSPIPEEEDEMLDSPAARPEKPFLSSKDKEEEEEHVPRVLQIRHSESSDLDSSRSSISTFREADEMKDIEVGTKEEGNADVAGTILGLHNVFIVLPQLLVTLLSSIVFAFLSPATVHHTNGNSPTAPPGAGAHAGETTTGSSSDAIGLIFRIGGCAAGFAAWLCWKMHQEEKVRQMNRY